MCVCVFGFRDDFLMRTTTGFCSRMMSCVFVCLFMIVFKRFIIDDDDDDDDVFSRVEMNFVRVVVETMM